MLSILGILQTRIKASKTKMKAQKEIQFLPTQKWADTPDYIHQSSSHNPRSTTKSPLIAEELMMVPHIFR